MSKMRLPPPGRPKWYAEDQTHGGLLYLGWGKRNFHKQPLPMHLKAGWCLTIVLRGKLTMTLPDQHIRLKQGDFLWAKPDSPFGWEQSETDGECELLIWTWKDAPLLWKPTFGNELHHILHLSNEKLHEFESLHREFRSQVGIQDDHQVQVITTLRQLLEIKTARNVQIQDDLYQPEQKNRMLAEQWIQGNLDLNNPVAALCDYLQISPSSLHRLFQASDKCSPGAYFRKIKLQEAKRLIEEEGLLVKQAAYQLGYKHPNDLSRALSRNEK